MRFGIGDALVEQPDIQLIEAFDPQARCEVPLAFRRARLSESDFDRPARRTAFHSPASDVLDRYRNILRV